VHPAAVEKHGSEHVGPVEVFGNKTVGKDEGVLGIRVKGEFEQKDENVDDNQEDRDDGLGVAGLSIA
jgi:hypothetical protein